MISTLKHLSFSLKVTKPFTLSLNKQSRRWASTGVDEFESLFSDSSPVASSTSSQHQSSSPKFEYSNDRGKRFEDRPRTEKFGRFNGERRGSSGSSWDGKRDRDFRDNRRNNYDSNTAKPSSYPPKSFEVVDGDTPGRSEGDSRDNRSNRGSSYSNSRPNNYPPRSYESRGNDARGRTDGDSRDYRRNSYSDRPKSYSPRPYEARGNDDRGRRDGDSRDYRGNRGNSYSDRSSRYSPRLNEEEEKHIPAWGLYDGDHIYGVSCVRLALLANRRQIDQCIIQSDMNLEDKKDSTAAFEIMELCKLKNIPIHTYSKHDLNMISENRPHQGFILRSRPLTLEPLKTLEPTTENAVVLALDEVNDPQNFGALLRTSFFLGADKVIVCAKNSAPLSAVVSKASAGAMEVMKIYSTDNMMRFLDTSKENGWKVIGTALGEKSSIPLSSLRREGPVIVVLGNEGAGMRTNIARRCDVLVTIPQKPQQSSARLVSEEIAAGVDSLNVSVTGAIVLHHLMSTESTTAATSSTATEQLTASEPL